MKLLNRKLRRKKLVKKIVKIQIITYSPLKRILNLALKKLGLIQMEGKKRGLLMSSR